MPTPQFPAVADNASVDELRDAYIAISRYLTYLLSALDTLNISRLDAKVVIANTVTADKMNVTQLSAIAADLGHITAGLIEAVTIIGSLIKTATSGQRIEISTLDNLLMAVNAAGNTLKMYSDYSATSPSFEWSDSSGKAYMLKTSTALNLNSDSNTDINVNSSKDLYLTPGAFNKAYVPTWDKFYASSLGQSLQAALDGKSDSFSGYTGSVTVVTGVDFVGETTTTSTLNISNGIVTSVT